MLGDIDEPTAPFGLMDVQGDGLDIDLAQRRLPLPLARDIRQQARRHGVSPASLMHLAWALVLARSTGRQDVVFGTVLFGRMQAGADADRVMGLFINTLPLRVSLADVDVVSALSRTRQQLADLLRHEHAPLALAQRCSGVEAMLPLFTALLNYRYGQVIANADGTLPEEAQRLVADAADADEGMELRFSEERTNYPLTLSIDDVGEDFVFTAQVSAPVAAERICDFMQTALASLVQALQDQPRQPLLQLEVLPADEREKTLRQWNQLLPDGRCDLPIGEAEPCLHQLFEAQAAASPQAVALRLDGQTLSYGELNARANRLAGHLRTLGVGPDALVAICVDRSFDTVVSLLAVLKAGGAYVPLDPAYASDRLHFTLQDSQPVALLCDAAGRLALGEDFIAQAAAAGLQVLDLQADATHWAGRPSQDLAPLDGTPTRPEHLAYVIYTSGSTGQPKGVMVEHRNVLRLFDSTQPWFGFGPADVWTLFHSFSFDFSVWEIWGPLLHGGSLVIVPLHAARSPADFHQLLCTQGVTVLNQTPSAFLQLSAAQAGSPQPHSLRTVIFGGEALELRTLKPWYEREVNAQTELVNMYGITETTVHVTYCPLRPADTERPGPSPIGQRIPDLRLYVLDAQGEPAPIGVTGELYVGGAGVARGYLRRPELTAERFVANRFEPGERLYRTGDLGRWLPDGTVEYLGRNDFQVKIRGFRIELGEIEAQLARAADVHEVVVLAREDVPGDKRLVAYYQGAAMAEELRALAQANLPPYMVPSAYVRLDSFPLTPNGKLDRRALPAPEGGAVARRAYEAPNGDTEEKLAAIWADLLQIDQVGRHDNFFELGGHSLLAIQLIERMRVQNMFVDIRTLFTAHALADLAAAVGTESGDVAVPANLIPAQLDDEPSDDEFEEFRL